MSTLPSGLVPMPMVLSPPRAINADPPRREAPQINTTLQGKSLPLKSNVKLLAASCSRPVEVLVEGDKWRIIRARETYEDLVRGETV